jgi:hypothetical protein
MFSSTFTAILVSHRQRRQGMAQLTIDQVTSPAARIRIALSNRLQALAEKLDERREIRRWLRQHPPSLGRSSGCRV